MSRNNVFKLSGNMALGSNEAYSNSDFENIKSSLKLLKSKQPQKKQEMPLQPTNYYGGSYSSNAPSRQQANLKNNPTNDYQNSYNYSSSNQNYNKNGGQTNSYKDIYPNPDPNPLKQKRNIPNYEQDTYQDKNTYQKYPPKGEQKDYRQPPQPQKHSQPQEKSIKEVNRENRIQIKEYDPSELIMCSEGCNRKFNPDSIAKHEGVCRQVFQKKRKQFNAQDQRIVANEQKKLMKRGQLVDKKLEQKKAKEKVPKWKAESLQLRSGLKQARSEDYVPTNEEKKILDAAKNNQFTKCDFCGRSFNQEAAKKHIPFCESQQKKNQMKRR